MNRMRLTGISLACAAFALGACGSDAGSSDADAVVEGTVNTETVAPDETTDQGSSTDEAGDSVEVDGDSIDVGQDVEDQIVAMLEQSGQAFDEECLRDLLSDMDLASFDGQATAPSAELMTQLTECFDFGG